jgi:hypothetical protein
LLAAIVTPLLAVKPPVTQMVTVEQLEQALATAHGVRDGNLAKQISNMKLTQRLSDARLARLENELPGSQTRLALVALADESQFLDLPAAEIPSTAVPGAAGQAELLARTMDYVNKTVAKLPNFYATRTTTRFVGTPTVIAYDLHERLFPDVAYQRLSAIGTTRVTLLYRDGQEVYADKKGVNSECYSGGAPGDGEFGEILVSLPEIASHGKVVWSHWEQGAGGLLAVFRYAGTLDYKWPRICPNEVDLPRMPVEFQGEIAVNPADGSILRLTRTDRQMEDLFGWGLRSFEADIMVEYGPVEIGGMTYICPVRSVVIGLGPHFYAPRSWRDSFNRSYGLSEDPINVNLENATFAQYHVFRAEMRFLPGDTPVPEATPPASTPATPAPHAPGTSPQR